MNSFTPVISGAKNITISLASQSVDLTSTGYQVRVVNTSTSPISFNWGLTSGTVTASFSDGGGLIINPGTSEVFSRPPTFNRFAVIGLAANGTAQICIGDGI